MRYISKQTIDSLACSIYKEFFDTHQELYKTDTIKYWHDALRYKDDRLREQIYALNHKIEKIIDI